jgi:hypothetical protein
MRPMDAALGLPNCRGFCWRYAQLPLPSPLLPTTNVKPAQVGNVPGLFLSSIEFVVQARKHTLSELWPVVV